MSTKKYEDILPGEATPSLWNRFLFNNNSKLECKCPNNQQNYFITYATKDDEYGTVITKKPDGTNTHFFGPNQNNRSCLPGDDDTIPCQSDTGKRSANFPMCIRQYDSTSTVDENTLQAHLGAKFTKIDDDYNIPSVCIGTYEYYECDLSEMANGLAKLARDVLRAPFSSIFRKIIYIIVAIVIIFLVMYLIRMFMTMERKQSFNGRGRRRKR
tara:strand:- start:340 stop:978 length:639 start_codon:yes stop_codon:yes gene_type:complete